MILAAALGLMPGAAAQDKPYHFKPYGFIRSYAFFDSRADEVQFNRAVQEKVVSYELPELNRQLLDVLSGYVPIDMFAVMISSMGNRADVFWGMQNGLFGRQKVPSELPGIIIDYWRSVPEPFIHIFTGDTNNMAVRKLKFLLLFRCQ